MHVGCLKSGLKVGQSGILGSCFCCSQHRSSLWSPALSKTGAKILVLSFQMNRFVVWKRGLLMNPSHWQRYLLSLAPPLQNLSYTCFISHFGFVPDVNLSPSALRHTWSGCPASDLYDATRVRVFFFSFFPHSFFDGLMWRFFSRTSSGKPVRSRRSGFQHKGAIKVFDVFEFITRKKFDMAVRAKKRGTKKIKGI